MLFRQTLAVTACSLAAQAFLIPLEVANSAIDTSNDSPISILSPSNRVIKLDCPGCAFAQSNEEDGSYAWLTNVENSLLLNFTADNERLSLNGGPLYPLPGLLLAPQVRSERSLVDLKTEGHSVPLQLSYLFEGGPRTPAVDEEGQLHSVQLKITAINAQVINVATVHVQALKDSSGKVSSAMA